jgi:hypothetical protein
MINNSGILNQLSSTIYVNVLVPDLEDSFSEFSTEVLAFDNLGTGMSGLKNVRIDVNGSLAGQIVGINTDGSLVPVASTNNAFKTNETTQRKCELGILKMDVAGIPISGLQNTQSKTGGVVKGRPTVMVYRYMIGAGYNEGDLVTWDADTSFIKKRVDKDDVCIGVVRQVLDDSLVVDFDFGIINIR